ncbi:HEPN domain-containing protein [Carboxydocella sporoproducens DSM 16521]|uniref:HEPN domain-containing protein n=2 Tax=Carboxydocella TaxID=178898 RepID=A0A1T4S8C5_9FIRM|nr:MULTISPECIES: HEPN domain-containing protein [Carboxydocella]AVX19647.1 HEPN domain-containing protein [Carboxydocella thermautotrophica]SKA24494.1 HEPN domain-containing protein [Carboxydocella sporoproducens DSM 16521]
MVDTQNYNEWLIMAQKDLRGARILFEHEADYELVCFHCQQAVEKYLKGYLIYKTRELQEGHNLMKLCKKAMIYNKKFGEFLKDLAFLNTFYIETRYPATEPLQISQEDAEESLRIAERFINVVEELLKA